MTSNYKNKIIRKLTKVGGYSYAVTLPISLIRKFNWRERQKLQLIIDEEKQEIIIKDWEKERSVKEKEQVDKEEEQTDREKEQIDEEKEQMINELSNDKSQME